MRVRKFHRLNEGFGFVEISSVVVTQKKDDYDTIEFTSDEKLSNGEIVVVSDEPFVIRNSKYIKNQSNEYSGEEFASRAKESIPCGIVALNETIPDKINYLLGNTFGAYFFDDADTLACTIEGEIWNCDDLFKYLNEEKGYTIKFGYDIESDYIYTTVNIVKEDELTFSKSLVENATFRYLITESQFTDITGNGYNGTVSNVTYDTDGSAILNGSNSLIDTHYNQQNLTSTHSIGAIVKMGVGGNTTNKGLMGDHSSSNGLMIMQYGNTTVGFQTGWYKNGYNTTIDIPSSAINNDYFYIVFVFDENKSKLYINGELYGTKENIEYLPINDTIKIGRSYNQSNRYWLGNISLVETYQKALTENEVKQNHEVYIEKELL